MAEQQMISASASSSNSSSMVSCKTYDVFLSFRGEDTRNNFTSHLYKALNQEKIVTFIDYQLKKGDEISPALIKAIEDSHVSVVILSKNYASSKWCLEELSKILECQKNQGQTVIPVFYNIDPSHVRKQIESYEQAFAKHEGDHRCNKWKTVLTEVANLSGWDSRDRVESKFLEDIVRDILQKLASKYPNHLEGLVGIEDRYEHIESLLKIWSSDVRTLGIWGMGGIGKTTLAKALYAKLSRQFDVSCFLENVRENSSRDGRLEALHNKLFSKLLGNENYCSDPPFVVSGFDMYRLGHKKVLIVLDDVDTSQQLESLIKDCSFLGPGSRIIVTTRNKKIFHEVVEVYEVKELSFHHSLKLFCLTAFGEEQPKHGYKDLSRRAISYCKGIPLALKVLGAKFKRGSQQAWESEFRKLQQTQNMEIHDILKLSYDDLEPSEKDIFLDIACFFKGEERDSVINLLEALNFFAESGIEVLLDYALITISDFNRIEMHDLIQQMGWKIVLQESIKDPGRRSRIWKPEEVQEVLKYNRGTDVVEGIILDLDTLTENLSLSSDSLAKMTNVRFLKIYRRNLHMWRKERFNVYIPNGLEILPYKLRYLHWEGFCRKSLPANFCVEQLVELRMPNSKLKKLWDGIQNVVNLKTIHLWGSRDLVEIPDLSKAEKLEDVHLDGCESLRELHPSMSSLHNLRELSIYYCRGIESLNVDSKSLQVLYAKGCSSLKEFSVTSVKMTSLDLSGISICANPSSIWRNRKLRSLSISSRNTIKLSYDSGVGSITAPDHYGCMQHNVSELPLEDLSLTKLHLDGCSKLVSLPTKLVSLPELPPSLTQLRLYGCSKVVSLPKLPPSLTQLALNGCSKLVSLPELPPSLTQLYSKGCSKLVSLPELPPSLTQLHLYGCSKVVSLPELPPSLTELHLNGCSKLVSLPELPPSLTWLHLGDCSKLVSLPELPPSLTRLDLDGCSKLVSLPELPPSLTQIYLDGCSKLMSLPELPPSLTWLPLNGCSKLVSLPDLPPSLRKLDLDDCSKLVSLPKLPPLLGNVSAENCTYLDTDSTQRLVLQHMLQSLNNPKYFGGHFIFPGDHMTDECGFRTAGRSITIPYLPIPPSSHLHGFIYYVILPKGFHRDDLYVLSIIRQDGKYVGGKTYMPIFRKLISEHVSFSYVEMDDVCSDHLPFKLEFYCLDRVGDKHHQESIKEFGVFPVYASESGLKLFGNTSSSKGIFELESIAQISENKSHPREIVSGGSSNDNEEDSEQLLPLSKRRRT